MNYYVMISLLVACYSAQAADQASESSSSYQHLSQQHNGNTPNTSKNRYIKIGSLLCVGCIAGTVITGLTVWKAQHPNQIPTPVSPKVKPFQISAETCNPLCPYGFVFENVCPFAWWEWPKIEGSLKTICPNSKQFDIKEDHERIWPCESIQDKIDMLNHSCTALSPEQVREKYHKPYTNRRRHK